MKLIFDCAYENWLMNGRRIRVLTIVDLWDRSSPAMEVDVALPGQRVVRVLDKLRLQGRLPRRLRTDNGPEFTGKSLDAWAQKHGVQLEFIRPASQWATVTLKALTANSGMSA